MEKRFTDQASLRAALKNSAAPSGGVKKSAGVTRPSGRDVGSTTVKQNAVKKNAKESLGVSSLGSSMLRRLDGMEEELSHHTAYTGNSRWMIPYSDLLTLLLGLFLVLSASFNVEQTSLENKSQKIEAELTEKSEVVEAQEAELGRLNTALYELSMSVQKQEEADRLEDAALPTEVMEKIPGISVARENRGIVITLRDNILFPPGQAELTAEARKTLDRLAEILATTTRPIRVEGHTDNTPIATSQYPSNWELSTARATHIVKYLIGVHRFSPDRLSAAGYGEFRPVAENSSIGGKQKNRRVDIVVLNTRTANFEPEKNSGQSGGQ